MFRIHRARLRLGAVALLVGGGCALAMANPLQQMHEAGLALARQEVAAARTPADKARAVGLQVAALNSLGRSEDALRLLDDAEAPLPVAQRNAELRVKVLLPLNRCDEAMPALQAAVDARDAAMRQVMGAAYQPGGPLMTATEDLLAQVYCHASQRRWDAAVAALSRVLDPMDPSLLHYQAAWYAALRKLGAAPRPSLDAASANLPRKAGVHDLSLAVVQGRMEARQALAELQRRRLAPADAQDAQAEILFFAAVAADAADARAPLLAQLEALSPYGSTEWVMARLLLGAR